MRPGSPSPHATAGPALPGSAEARPTSDPPRPPVLRIWPCALAGWALWTVWAWWLEHEPAAFDEPLWLRWSRACAEHPVRGPLALGLLCLGLRRLRAGPEGAGFAPAERL